MAEEKKAAETAAKVEPKVEVEAKTATETKVKPRDKSSRLSLYEENEVNAQFDLGQQVTFTSEAVKEPAAAVITRKYTNSCLVDFAENEDLSRAIKDEYHSKMVVSYKRITIIK